MARRPLRAWQQAALAAWRSQHRPDFLVCASPGAGKTTMALAAAAAAFSDQLVDQLVIVCPSDHLRRQWADAAAALGMPVDPGFANSDPVTSPEFCGIVVTYAQVASAPDIHQGGVSGARTFVILDEIHHAGQDKHWGDALTHAYGGATYRLALSGTPWRSDTNPIPFVRYEPDEDGVLRSKADFRYGYADALADHVVRPVLFMAYSGQARWQDSAGIELEAHLDDPMSTQAMRHAWRTALDPAGDWIEAVLKAADARLSTVRAAGMADAAGLVIASNRTHARAYGKLLEAICGEPVTVVVSDDSTASDKIEAFALGRARWVVAVRMISEGVDIPRCAVEVYATNVSAPLFFAQAVGRVVRARNKSETSTMFLPSVAPLLALAAELEAERDHALAAPAAEQDGAELGLLDDEALTAANPSRSQADLLGEFKALQASGHLDRVIYAGAEHGTGAATGSAAESTWLTLPGLLDPADLARTVQARASGAMTAEGSHWNGTGRSQVSIPMHRQISAARRELHGLVGAVHHRTGAQHGEIHARLRAVCGGPQSAAATLDQLEARIAAARSWL